MKQQILNLIFCIIAIGALIVWGNYQSKKSVEKEKEIAINGFVVRMHKQPGDKNYTVKFSNGNLFKIAHSPLNDFIEITDSLSKKAGSLEYYIYKFNEKRIIIDSIIYKAPSFLDGTLSAPVGVP